jgi:hypothetical protein
MWLTNRRRKGSNSTLCHSYSPLGEGSICTGLRCRAKANLADTAYLGDGRP